MQSTKTKFVVSEITWDTDGEQVDLPTSIEIEVDHSNPEYQNYEGIEQFISDELSNRTGFCHLGFATSPEIETVYIKIIQAIIQKCGAFTVADVEADHSPYFPSKGRSSHLAEEFDEDGVKVFVYDPQSHSSDEIDSYSATYEEMDDDQIEYILQLAQRWAEISEE